MAEPSTMADAELFQRRRRARRRLVGAVALALAAVVVLPMLFDPQPRPLGEDVDILIPDASTPFPGESAVAQPPPPRSGTGATDPSGTGAADTSGTAPSSAVAQPPARPEVAHAPPASTPRPAPAPGPPPVTEASRGASASGPRHGPPPAAPPPRPSAPTGAVGPEALPTSPPVAAPPTAVAQPSGPSLQLGVFASEANARQLMAQAEAVGVRARLLSQGDRYRVWVGPFDSRAEALAAQARLREKGLTSVLVAP